MYTEVSYQIAVFDPLPPPVRFLNRGEVDFIGSIRFWLDTLPPPVCIRTYGCPWGEMDQNSVFPIYHPLPIEDKSRYPLVSNNQGPIIKSISDTGQILHQLLDPCRIQCIAMFWNILKINRTSINVYCTVT